MNRLLPGLVCVGLVMLAFAGLSHGGGPGPGRSLEDQLMEDLQSNPLDADAERDLRSLPSKEPSPQEPAGPQKPSEKADQSLDQKLKRELGAAAVSESENPLSDIVQKMQQAQTLLAQAKTGEPTQKLQADVLKQLDELLKAARKRCQSCSSGQCNSQKTSSRRTPSQSPPKEGSPSKPGNQPAKATTAKPGSKQTPSRSEVAARKELLKNVWGELPQRDREQMLELPIEEFLPKYESLIEAYFKRLAEEPGGGGSDR